ncbi:hypothetical protein IWQ56_003518, partial [Coemansia nantahalensis]
MAAPVKVLEYIVLEETSGFAWSHASPSACTVETIKELLSSQHPDTDSSDRLRILPRNGGSSHLLSSYVSADDDKLNSWGFADEQAGPTATDSAGEEQQTHTASSSDGDSGSDSGSDRDSDRDSDSGSESESEPDITQRNDIPEALRPQVDRLRALRARLATSSQDNKRDLYKEHQRHRENPGEEQRQERKRREAQKLKLREEYAGDDYER